MMNFMNLTHEEIVAIAAANSPNPTKDHMDLQRRLDRNRNPHNDGPPKPPIRNDEEIVADFKLQHGLAVLAAVEKHFKNGN
jgi:hypothetical protein